MNALEQQASGAGSAYCAFPAEEQRFPSHEGRRPALKVNGIQTIDWKTALQCGHGGVLPGHHPVHGCLLCMGILVKEGSWVSPPNMVLGVRAPAALRPVMRACMDAFECRPSNHWPSRPDRPGPKDTSSVASLPPPGLQAGFTASPCSPCSPSSFRQSLLRPNTHPPRY